MDERELKKIEEQKEMLKKYIEKIYNTMSINQETLATEDMNALIKKMDKNVLIEFASTFDVFGKCVLYYKTPIELRLDPNFISITRVEEIERIEYWKKYKKILKEKKFNPEEEYNKIIMMACILHVPIDEKDDEIDKPQIES